MGGGGGTSKESLKSTSSSGCGRFHVLYAEGIVQVRTARWRPDQPDSHVICDCSPTSMKTTTVRLVINLGTLHAAILRYLHF